MMIAAGDRARARAGERERERETAARRSRVGSQRRGGERGRWDRNFGLLRFSRLEDNLETSTMVARARTIMYEYKYGHHLRVFIARKSDE